jgi:filamentous hemagglutinin family protein
MRKSSPYKVGVLSHMRRRRLLRVATAMVLFPAMVQWDDRLRANPRGGSVVHGKVAIGGGAGGKLRIQQSSANAIIHWDDFSIKADELTQFVQPNKQSAVLNRVTGGDPSEIHGALRANGNVFVINPNGILVGPGGSIDVHGLVLSTLDVDNGEFLARGDLVLQGATGAGVTNMGRINAIGGDVFLIGRTVTNSGAISATGTVGLAAGE